MNEWRVNLGVRVFETYVGSLIFEIPGCCRWQISTKGVHSKMSLDTSIAVISKPLDFPDFTPNAREKTGWWMPL